MACSLSNLPAIASTRSTPISAINSRWKLQWNTSPSPVGKRLQSNVRLCCHQRRKNALVVRVETCPENMGKVQENTTSKTDAEQKTGTVENTTSKSDAEQKLTTVISPFGFADLFLPLETMQQMLDMMERDALSVRTPWCIMENENELKMRFDMPGLSKDDVKVSVVDHRFLVIEDKEKREKDLWSFYSTYNTRLMLPENYETNKIKTELNNGVLNLTIPRVKVESELKDLSQNCEMGKIVAEFRNGVLNITIPTSKVESKVKGLPVK